MKNENIKKIAFLGLLSAMAYVSLFFIRIPIIPSASFLRYDVKDVFMVIGAFMFGPLYGLAMAIVVAFLQMLTASEYGLIGFAMNTLSSATFVCIASFIHKKIPKLYGTVTGLIGGCIAMTVTMLLWNYLFTPLYMGVPRETVKAMLIPVFLPFNLIKSGINAVVSLILYKTLAERLKNKYWK